MVLYRNFGFPILNIKEKHMQSKTSENICFSCETYFAFLFCTTTKLFLNKDLGTKEDLKAQYF